MVKFGFSFMLHRSSNYSRKKKFASQFVIPKTLKHPLKFLRRLVTLNILHYLTKKKCTFRSNRTVYKSYNKTSFRKHPTSHSQQFENVDVLRNAENGKNHLLFRIGVDKSTSLISYIIV